MEIVRDLRARLVVVDPLSTICQITDENSSADVIQRVRLPLQALMSATEATVLALHHSTKGAQWGEPQSSLDLVRGSGDLTAMTGSILGVWAARGRGIVKAIPLVRGPSAVPFILAPRGMVPLNLGRHAATTKFEPVAYAGDWDDGRAAPWRKVLEVILSLWEGTPLTPARIADASEFSPATVYRHLKELESNKIIARTPQGIILLESETPNGEEVKTDAVEDEL